MSQHRSKNGSPEGEDKRIQFLWKEVNDTTAVLSIVGELRSDPYDSNPIDSFDQAFLKAVKGIADQGITNVVVDLSGFDPDVYCADAICNEAIDILERHGGAMTFCSATSAFLDLVFAPDNMGEGMDEARFYDDEAAAVAAITGAPSSSIDLPKDDFETLKERYEEGGANNRAFLTEYLKYAWYGEVDDDELEAAKTEGTISSFIDDWWWHGPQNWYDEVRPFLAGLGISEADLGALTDLAQAVFKARFQEHIEGRGNSGSETLVHDFLTGT